MADDAHLAQSIGAVIGAAAASAAASWAAMSRHVSRKMGNPAETTGRIEARLDRIEKDFDELRRDLREMHERLVHLVEGEEFAEYARTTTESITALIEKVGHVSGAIDAWYRSVRR